MEGSTAFSINQLKRPLAVFLFAFVIPGWVLSAMPGLESTLLAMPSAHLAAFQTGTPLQYLQGNWIRSLPKIIASSLALSLVTTLIVNAMRITLVIRMHRFRIMASCKELS